MAIICTNLDDLLPRLPSAAVVTTNGCFELLHVGHTRYLAAAKAEGDCLVVLVNTDASMGRLKPDRKLLVPQAERMEVIAAIASVDFVIPLEGDTPTSMLAHIRPAVHVKGTDYDAKTLPEREVVERHGGRIAIVGPPKEWSSTALRERLTEGERTMAFEFLVGLQVSDDVAYDRYRAAMKPILVRFGGGFRYDFRVAEVLRSETAEPINRVFTIHFRDEAASAAFFADPEYLAVRDEHFEPSVAAMTIIAKYSRG